MTCIVGLEHDGKVYMGCDSGQSDGHFTSSIDVAKIFTNRDITFGYTSSFRFADLLQYDLKIPIQDGTPDREYLVSAVVKEIRSVLHRGGYATVNNNTESGGTALLAFKSKLYRLQDDYSLVRDLGGYAACGSGANFALGSLASTDSITDPAYRVELALQAAIKHCATVQGPTHQVIV
jgi:ATP-dependent protease HslVU (ClpYQ) peptidase subunit